MAQQTTIGRYRTTIEDDGIRITVKYFDTVVFLYDRNDTTLVLDTGGWFTRSTKDRMNQALNQYGIGGYVSGGCDTRSTEHKGDWELTINGWVIPFNNTDALGIKVSEWQ